MTEEQYYYMTEEGRDIHAEKELELEYQWCVEYPIFLDNQSLMESPAFIDPEFLNDSRDAPQPQGPGEPEPETETTWPDESDIQDIDNLKNDLT